MCMVHEELEELVEVASLPVSRASLADVEPDAGAPDATAAMEGAALLPRVPTPRAFLPARKLQMAGATVSCHRFRGGQASGPEPKPPPTTTATTSSI